MRGTAIRPLAGLLVIVASIAGGCSTMTDLAGISHAGHQSDGSYVLLASEQGLDCPRLKDQIEIALKDMEKAKRGIDAERAEIPKTLVGVYGRMFGGTDGGLKSAENYRRSEQRVRALNAQLGANGCQGVNVDAHIMAFDLAPMNDPATLSTASTTAGASQTASGSPMLNSRKVEVDTKSSFTPAAQVQ